MGIIVDPPTDKQPKRTPSGLPRLICVPDDIWPDFLAALDACGIRMIDTDADRSFKVRRPGGDA